MPIQVVNTRNVLKTSFAAGIRVSSDMDTLFLSGVTARPLDLLLRNHSTFRRISINRPAWFWTISRACSMRRELPGAKSSRSSGSTLNREVTRSRGVPWGLESLQHDARREQLPEQGAKIMYDVTAVVPRT
ncbi:MAG: hypothetical protein CM1200mP36_11310 [Gammaproteobacteria bacterium]|nr:MAG: hypothetical protein CM1200mP36_11310 [Gammaproteobacteria bacterium]